MKLADGYSSPPSRRAVFLLGMLPAIFFVVLRGNVGTDTGNYLDMAGELAINLNSSHEDFDVEIGFFLLLKGLVAVVGEPHIVINTISLAIVIYAFRLFSGSMERIVVFSLLVFPVFFFDMSMNGLRYALAFLVAKDASDRWDNGRPVVSIMLVTLCVSLQISGLLVFLLLRSSAFKARNLVLVLPFIALFGFAFADRLAYKFAAYQMLESPGSASGLLPLLIFFGAYIAVCMGDKLLVHKFAFLAVLEALSFILARFTYAGLRFQLLILFVFFCSISSITFTNYAGRKNIVVGCMLMVGFVGFLGSIKHYVDDMGALPTPFLPYTFFWEVR
jgi:hypothetical protein